ncbi:MAG: hypothetical protein KJP05_03830 [Deltaproteobacteria bacterium]|nr:hypothetical protein [Deltaproteobacteria bacterium]
MSANTDARYRGGVVRSSDETSVMEVERRGDIVQLAAKANFARRMS